MPQEDFFELFQLPFSLYPNRDEVKKNFIRLSKQYHPDRFTLQAQAVQDEALQQTAQINKAYKIFQNTDSLLGYILKQLHIIEEEEQFALPQDFLMDMMDLNEMVSDWEMEKDNVAAQKQAEESYQSAWQTLENNLQLKAATWQDWGDVHKDSDALKDLYYRRKYLLRVKKRIDTFATHS